MANRHLRHLGLRVRALRTARGLSQEKLGELSGLHRTYVSGIERGERNVSALNLIKIAAALGVTVGDFFAEAGGEVRS